MEYEYLPAFRGITRSNNDWGGICIDNFLNKKSELLKLKSHKLLHKLTDHEPLLLNIDISIDDNQDAAKKTINYKRLSSLSIEVDWSINEIVSVDAAMDSLISKIRDLVGASMFSRKRNTNQPRKTWITKGLIRSSKTKDMLYKNWQKDKNNVELKKNTLLFLINIVA